MRIEPHTANGNRSAANADMKTITATNAQTASDNVQTAMASTRLGTMNARQESPKANG
jgi:hypothetical protein